MLSRGADLEEQKILLDLLNHFREVKAELEAQKKSFETNNGETIGVPPLGDER